MANIKVPLTETAVKHPQLIAQLREAFGKLYDENSKIVPGKEQDAKAFLDSVHAIGIPEDSTTKQIGIILENWYETLTTAPEYSEPTMTGAPEYPVSATTPTEPTREIQAEELERQEEGLRTSTAESKAAVQTAIKRQKEIYAEQIRKAEAAQKTLKDKEVYVKKETPIPPEKTQQVIETLKTQAQADPVKTIDAYAGEMRARITDESIPDEAIQIAAVYTVANVISDGNPAMQAAVTEFVAKNAIKIGGKDLIDPAMALSDQQMSLKELSTTLNIGAFGENFAKAAVPEWYVSATPQPDYSGTSIGFIPPVAKVLIEKQSETLTKTGATLQIETRDFVQRWQDEIARGSVQGGAFNAITVQESLRALPTGPTPLAGSIGWNSIGDATGLGTPISIAGGIIKQKIAGKVASTIATKLGLKATLQAIGSAAPGVGNAAAFVAGEVLSRINLKTIKRYSAYIIAGLAGLVALPFIGLGAAIGVGALAGLGSMAFGAGAGGLTLGGIGAGVAGFFGALAGATLGAIGIPILVTLLGFPIAVAIILFIINSGAYIVPPSLQSLGAVNEYLDVSKTANPAGPFQNSQLPVKITYTITITAKKEALTNVSVKHECSAITKAGTKSCPAPNITVPGGTINIGSPFTFSYDATYDTSYKDALVANTVTVTASVTSESKSQEVEGGASITIGNPPTGCLKVDGAWPAGFKANIEAAASTLATKYSTYVSKVCSSYSQIPLRFNAGGGGGYWGWNHGSYIDFYSIGVNSQANALYTLSHELGHSLAWGSKTAFIYARYLAFAGIKSEAPYCFYSATKSWNAGESMPEAIALYVIQPRCGNVQQKWPIHYRFLQQYIFK